uniref:Uncharacterized protein n=1 Tax=Anopheles atroparvus TaxID=41427 RepID=A0AAG5DPK2_ANOAO
MAHTVEGRHGADQWIILREARAAGRKKERRPYTKTMGRDIERDKGEEIWSVSVVQEKLGDEYSLSVPMTRLKCGQPQQLTPRFVRRTGRGIVPKKTSHGKAREASLHPLQPTPGGDTRWSPHHCSILEYRSDPAAVQRH